MRGRFAPSPTGPLHLGNLRTALAAWLFARADGSEFLVRMEDLDAAVARPEHEAGQLADLAALGLDWDGPVVRQSDRDERYAAAIAGLADRGLVYECYCTRREIQSAASAPNGGGFTGDQAAPDGAYPGTCRALTAAERRARRESGRRPALRLRSDNASVSVVDRLLGGGDPADGDGSPWCRPGSFTGVVDDVVLRRNDGAYAYNLAVVVDDAAQDVEEVVRGDDLLSSTPRQAHLAGALGLSVPAYAHVPLVLAPDGSRLAKRHGAVTLADRRARGEGPATVLSMLAASLGLLAVGEQVTTAAELVDSFDADRLPIALWRTPWVLSAASVVR